MFDTAISCQNCHALLPSYSVLLCDACLEEHEAWNIEQQVRHFMRQPRVVEEPVRSRAFESEESKADETLSPP